MGWKNLCINPVNSLDGQKHSLGPGQEGLGWTGSRHPGGHNDDDTLTHHWSGNDSTHHLYLCEPAWVAPLTN